MCDRTIGLFKGAYFPMGSKAAEYFANKTSVSGNPDHPNNFASLHGTHLEHIARVNRNCASGYDWIQRTKVMMSDATAQRTRGLCCGHVTFRSLADILPKLRKNANFVTYNMDFIATANFSSPLWAFWDRVVETDQVDLWNLFVGNRTSSWWYAAQ